MVFSVAFDKSYPQVFTKQILAGYLSSPYNGPGKGDFMSWCPSCGYEYRSQVTVCPKCQVPLTDEAPPPPPSSVEQIEANAADYTRPMQARIQPGLELARNASRSFFRAKRLLLVVLLLATLYYAVGIARERTTLASYQQQGQQLPTPEPSPRPSVTAILSQWFDSTRIRLTIGGVSPHYLLSGFSGPLAIPVGALTNIPELAALPTLMKQLSKVTDTRGFLAIYLTAPLLIGLGLLTTLLSAAILVPLINWLFSLIGTGRRQDWRGALKAHYLPMLAFLFCSGIITSVLTCIASLNEITAMMDAGLAGNVSNAIYGWLLPLSNFLLMFAPFAIVGLGLGAWGGVMAGLRILWQQKWTVLMVLIIYRVIFELIYLLRMLLPSSRFASLQPTASVLISGWLMVLTTALLGLWVALAIAMIVNSSRAPVSVPQPVEVAV